MANESHSPANNVRHEPARRPLLSVAFALTIGFLFGAAAGAWGMRTCIQSSSVDFRKSFQPESASLPPTAAAPVPQANFPLLPRHNMVMAGPAMPMAASVADGIASLQAAMDTSSPERALALLEEQQAALAQLAPSEADAWRSQLIPLYERSALRASATPYAHRGWLALARAYWSAGYPSEGLEAIEQHARVLGEWAREDVLAQGEPAAEGMRAAQRAMAGAYHDEALWYYRQKDYSASLRHSERLLALYPSSIKAYEGQMIAARCHMAMRQPSGVIASYRRIAEGSPDERFAQAAAETALRLLVESGRIEEALADSRRWRERFANDEFRVFAMLTEGELLKKKGTERYPEALAVFREAARSGSGSPAGRRAEAQAKEMLDFTFGSILSDAPAGIDF